MEHLCNFVIAVVSDLMTRVHFRRNCELLEGGNEVVLVVVVVVFDRSTRHVGDSKSQTEYSSEKASGDAKAFPRLVKTPRSKGNNETICRSLCILMTKN